MKHFVVGCLLLLAVSPLWGGVNAQEKGDVARYIEGLRGGDPSGRVKAAEALANLGPSAQDATPALVDCLQDKNPLLRQKAIIALGLIRGHPKLAVPALVKALDDKGILPEGAGTTIPQSAVLALANYGPEAADAVPALLERAKSGPPDLKGQCVVALGRIKAQGERVVPLLLEYLTGKDDGYLRGQAARALVRFGPDRAFVSPLRKAFACEDVQERDRKATIQYQVLRALGDLGKYAEPEIPWMLTVFKDRANPRTVRDGALQAIAGLGPVGKKAIPELVKCLTTKEYNSDSNTITRTLLVFGDDAVNPLKETLQSKDRHARLYAIQALERFGPRAKAAIPELQKLVNDDDRGIRAAARFALVAIEKK